MARDHEIGRDRESRQDGLEERVVKIRRCAAVVKGGRRFSFNALVVVGDKQRPGRLRLRQGQRSAARRREGRQGRRRKRSSGRSKISAAAARPSRTASSAATAPAASILVPAGPGTGVKAGPGVRDVLERCGIHNILTKVHGSTNPINLVKATIDGLLQLRTREEVARLRGVTL